MAAAELSTSQPPLTAIVERRNASGEESDDDEEEGDEWQPGPSDREAHGDSGNKEDVIVKSGHLWKKGERRKVNFLRLGLVLLVISVRDLIEIPYPGRSLAIFDALFRTGRSGGLCFGPPNWLLTRTRKNTSSRVFWTCEMSTVPALSL